MSSNTAINFKVFLRNDSNTEARRFAVDTDVVTNFEFMKEKLQTVFPILRDCEFKLTWKDADGDEITISSDEDLITAFTEMAANQVKVLYVSVFQRNSEADIVFEAEIPPRPYNIICDGCQTNITGFRYKCMQCPDFDLCSRCEAKGMHPEHVMMRVASTDSFMPRFTRKFMNHISRSMRKAAHHASRDAYRASKHCPFYGSNYSADSSKPKETGNQTGADKNQSQTKGCPFSSGQEINLNDLQELAKQHLQPFVEALSKPSNKEHGASSGSSSEVPVLIDMIRNAVDGFFGRPPNSTPEQTTETGQQDKPSTPHNSPTAPQSQPMDVEHTNAQNATTSKATSPEARRPEGWTFVTNEHITTPVNQETATNNTAATTAPTVTSSAITAVPSMPQNLQHPNPVIADGLRQLYEMGFSNENGVLTNLLITYNGNVAQVVRALIEQRI